MSRLAVISDLWGFLRYRKKFWLLPMVTVLLVLGVLLVFTETSAIAPFVYSLF